MIGIYRTPRAGGKAAEVNPYSDALSAWSLIDLGTGYSGNVVRVRENSGENEANFGFVGGVLDIAGIEAHLDIDTPNANGFVHTLYDIAGGGNDMTNSTASTQFKIGATGTVLTNADGDPAMEGSTGTSLYLQNTSPPSLGTSDFTVHATIQSDDQAFFRRIVDFSGGGAVFAFYIRSDGTLQMQMKDENLNLVTHTTALNAEDGNVHRITYTIDRVGDISRCYYDGIEQNTASILSVTGNLSMNTWQLGTAGSQKFWQYLNQVVIWNRVLTAAEVAGL